MKTLELEIVQGFFFLPSLRIPLHICEVGLCQFSGFFKAFEKAINMHHTSLFFSCLTISISGVKK